MLLSCACLLLHLQNSATKKLDVNKPLRNINGKRCLKIFLKTGKLLLKVKI